MNCPVCKNKFEPNTGRRPKRFCSDACKVKFWNEQKKGKKETIPPQVMFSLPIKDLKKSADIKKYAMGTIPPMPVREKGEDALDFAARKSEWKKKYNQ